MKKALISLLACLLFGFTADTIKAQNVVDGVVPKERISGRKPIPYAATRESDIMWEKTIWRVIDLREKMNHPLYYPMNAIDNRMSLFNLLIYGIKNEGLTPYDPNDDEFKVPMTIEQVEKTFDAVDRMTQVEDPDTGELIEQVVKGEFDYSEVQQILLKEKWYFDKNLSKMEIRIIGICPIRFYTKEGNDQIQRKLTFWVYFPEARSLFANHEVFNPKNDANRLSFDDIFHKRRFSSYVTGESNVYNNRKIIEYAQGFHSLLEAERVKQELFEKEHDFWEY